MKFDIREFLENLSRKFKFHSNLTRITSTFHEDRHIFLIISRPIMLKMWNVSDISCTETQNKHFTSNKIFFFRKSCLLWDNVERRGRATPPTDDNIAHAYFMLGT